MREGLLMVLEPQQAPGPQASLGTAHLWSLGLDPAHPAPEGPSFRAPSCLFLGSRHQSYRKERGRAVVSL